MLNLITDRSATDVQRWEILRDKGIINMTAAELAEWNAGMKGAYNATDLNRVGEALNYLRGLLTQAGYLGGNEFNAKTSWADDDIPTSTQFAEYINAVETIRAAMSRKPTTPPTPINTNSLDYRGANDIERILLDIEELIPKMKAARNFCGELFGGEI